MNKDFNLENIVVANGDTKNISIGNLIYFTVGNLYVPQTTMERIATESGMPSGYFNGNYHSTHAFMTATQDCLPKSNKKYKVKIFTNEQEDFVYSRELKIEEKAKKENPLTHLANIYYNSETDCISYDIDSSVAATLDYNVHSNMQEAIYRFTLIKQSISRERLVTKVVRYLKQELEASSISAHGNLYFVPAHNRDKLLILETFFKLLKVEYEKIQQESAAKQTTSAKRQSFYDIGVRFTSLVVLNTEEYVKEYTEEYYIDTLKEIETIKKKLSTLNEKDNISQRVLAGYLSKVNKLIERKKKYEVTLNSTLEDLDLDIYEIKRELIALDCKVNINITQTELTM